MGFGFLFTGFAALVAYGVVMASNGAILDPTGLWLGPWPYEGAKDCRTKIMPSGQFEFECRADSKYVGMGTWSRSGNELVFKFKHFQREGSLVTPPPTKTLKIDGVRNTLLVSEPRGRNQRFRWHRGPL